MNARRHLDQCRAARPKGAPPRVCGPGWRPAQRVSSTSTSGLVLENFQLTPPHTTPTQIHSSAQNIIKKDTLQMTSDAMECCDACVKHLIGFHISRKHTTLKMVRHVVRCVDGRVFTLPGRALSVFLCRTPFVVVLEQASRRHLFEYVHIHAGQIASDACSSPRPSSTISHEET